MTNHTVMRCAHGSVLAACDEPYSSMRMTISGEPGQRMVTTPAVSRQFAAPPILQLKKAAGVEINAAVSIVMPAGACQPTATTRSRSPCRPFVKSALCPFCSNELSHEVNGNDRDGERE